MKRVNSDLGWAEKAVERYWRTLENSITELKKDTIITDETTIKELSEIIKENVTT